MALRRAPVSLARRAAAAAVALALLWGCGSTDGDLAAPAPGAEPPDPTTTALASDPTSPTSTSAPIRTPPVTRPSWLGTRVLEAGPDGPAAPQPTPPELDPRILPTIDLLPPPVGDAFEHTVEPVPDDVIARSTWSPECPVARADLRYVTVSFWGFDGLPHTGELLVHADAAADGVEVFRSPHADRLLIDGSVSATP